MWSNGYAVASTGSKKKHLTADKERTICGYSITELLPNYGMPEADCQRCWRVYEQRTGEGAPVEVGTEKRKRSPYVLDADIVDDQLHVSIADGDKSLDLRLGMEQVRSMADHMLEVRYQGQTILVPASELYRAIGEYETTGERDETPAAAPSG